MICNTNLTAKEIIYLDYVQGYKVSAANQLDAEKLKRLISSGLLTVGTLKESLQFTDMPKLRDLSKAKSLKANGKKAEIVQRISEKYTDEELERIGIERRLVATQDGKQILDYYDVVVTYHKSFGMKKQLDLCDLMIARNERPRADKEDILISLFLEKLNRTKKVGEKIVLLNMLENVYSWKKDEIKIHEVKKEIQHCQKIWEAEYQQEKAQAEANFSLRFGLSHESMERIKQETEKQLPKPCREESPYILNDQVKQLIHTWNENQRDVEHSILTILETIGSNLKMSKYQLSLTYKELGDMYATHEDYVKAVAAYEIGLALNHNLAVKAMLKKLKKKLPKHTDPITAIPWPKIIEDEKRFSANNYHLPNTYDADWKEKKEIAIERKRAGHNIATNVVLCGDKRKDFEMICGITIAIARFLAGIQTEASKFVDSIDNLNDMEDAAFSKLFNLLCVGFDAQMMQSARKVADCRIRQHLPDDILTIREEIILDLYSMRKTVNE